MSNSDSSELTHSLKATLTIDCGDHEEHIIITDYPTINTAGLSSGARAYGRTRAFPVKIKFDDDEYGDWYNLFDPVDIRRHLSKLQENVNNVLQASLVNEKQRKAVEELIGNYFRNTLDSFWSIK